MASLLTHTHSLFQTATINRVGEVEGCADPDGLRKFHYLVQHLHSLIMGSLISLHLKVWLQRTVVTRAITSVRSKLANPASSTYSPIQSEPEGAEETDKRGRRSGARRKLIDISILRAILPPARHRRPHDTTYCESGIWIDMDRRQARHIPAGQWSFKNELKEEKKRTEKNIKKKTSSRHQHPSLS